MSGNILVTFWLPSVFFSMTVFTASKKQNVPLEYEANRSIRKKHIIQERFFR